MFILNIVMSIGLVAQVPALKKAPEPFTRPEIKEILMGKKKLMPDVNDKNMVNMINDTNKLPVNALVYCIFRGTDEQGNIIIEVPDKIANKHIKMVQNPVVLGAAGQEKDLSYVEPGKWVHIFISEQGVVEGIKISPVKKEVR